MAACVYIDSSGYVVSSGVQVDQCTSLVLIDSMEYQAAINTHVTAAEIGEAFAWGFGSVVVLGWFSGYAIGLAKRLIRLI